MHKAGTVVSAIMSLAAIWVLSTRAAAQPPAAGTPPGDSSAVSPQGVAQQPAGTQPEGSRAVLPQAPNQQPTARKRETASTASVTRGRTSTQALAGRKMPIIAFYPTPAGGVVIDDADQLTARLWNATPTQRLAVGGTQQEIPLTPTPICTAWADPCPSDHPQKAIRLGNYRLDFFPSGEVILASWPSAASEVPTSTDQSGATAQLASAPSAAPPLVTSSGVKVLESTKDWEPVHGGNLTPVAQPGTDDVLVTDSIKTWVSAQPDGRFIVSSSTTHIEAPNAPPTSHGCRIEVSCPKPTPNKPH